MDKWYLKADGVYIKERVSAINLKAKAPNENERIKLTLLTSCLYVCVFVCSFCDCIVVMVLFCTKKNFHLHHSRTMHSFLLDY